MKPIPWSKLRIPANYAGGGLAAFLLFLFLTFPYDAIRERLTSDAQAQGLHLHMDSLGPGFFGVTARGVRLSKALAPGETKPAEPLLLDSVTLRPSLFPLGVSVHADALGGSVSASVGGVSGLSLHLSASGVDLSKGNLKGATGVDLQGTLDGELNLDLPATIASPGAPAVPNLSQASGAISLSVHQGVLRGGTVTLPYYGQMTPFDLPRIAIGNLDASVKIDKGLATIDRLASQGGDVDLLVSGTLRLAQRLDYSEAALVVKLKPSPQMLSNGFIGMGLAALPPDPSSPGYRAARMTGFLSSPTFVPGA